MTVDSFTKGRVMFVSSYSTYIDTSSTKRVAQERRDVEKKSSKSFSSKLLQTTPKNVTLTKELPLNYISNYKALHNRQQLQEKSSSQNSETMKFTKLNSLSSAQVAYGDNSKMFSLVQKPKQTLDQTPKPAEYLPETAQEKQESIMRVKMVNAYISNDNYYRITAA